MKTAVFLLSCALLAGAAPPAAAQCDLPDAVPARDSAGVLRYGESAAWYRNNEPIAVYGIRWVKYGLPRTLSASELRFIGEHQGVPVYAEAGARVIELVYVLLNAACQVQPYEAHSSLQVVSTDPAPPAGSWPAALTISGCPKGAELYMLPAARIAADPAWRSKLVPQGPGYIGVAWWYRVLVFTPTPQPYDVVLAWRGRTWRYRVNAVPGRETEVKARPPGRGKCEVPVYPVM
jgi:hypothetical protein